MISRFLPEFTVRRKVWGGFGVLLVLMAILAAVSYRALFNVEDEVTFVVKKLQPTMLASQDLSQSLAEATGALGLFLLTQEESNKVAYQAATQSIKNSLAHLESLMTGQNEQTDGKLLRLRDLVERFNGYEAGMIGLVADPLSNMRGLSFSAEYLNPIGQEMLQVGGEMIAAEFEESTSPMRREILNTVHEMRYNWTRLMSAVRAYIAFRGKSALVEIDLYAEATQSKIEKLTSFGDDLTFEQEDGLTRVAELKEQYLRYIVKLQRLDTMGKWRTDTRLIREEITPLLNELDQELQTLLSEQRSLAVEGSESLLASLKENAAFIGMLLIVALIIGVGIAWLCAAQIVTPILGLRDILKDMALGEGNLTQRASLASSDELGEATGYFNKMMAGLQQTVIQISMAALQVDERAETTSGRMDSVRVNMIEGAELSRSTAVATEEMSATSQEIARNAETAANVATEAQQQANNGSEQVKQMSDHAQAMRSQFTVLQERVNEIEAKGESMNAVIGVINAVAEQTNLLALNAAIEAARAGEAGRGFAVVADEVRHLATKTQESTAKIREMLESNQLMNRELVASMGHAADATGSVLQSIDTTEGVITQITASIGEMNDMVAQISSAAGHQSTVSQEIAHNVENLSSKEHENTKLMEAGNDSLEHLSDTAIRLNKVVAQFKF